MSEEVEKGAPAAEKYLDLPEPLREWVGELDAAIKENKSHREIVNLMVNGVHDPKDCTCDPLDHSQQPDSNETTWLHNNHRQYNAAVYEVIAKAGLIPAMRRVLTLEINRRGELEGYGRDLHHDISNGLLEGFLNDAPEWC